MQYTCHEQVILDLSVRVYIMSSIPTLIELTRSRSELYLLHIVELDRVTV
jgi:hypothetical protein